MHWEELWFVGLWNYVRSQVSTLKRNLLKETSFSPHSEIQSNVSCRIDSSLWETFITKHCARLNMITCSKLLISKLKSITIWSTTRNVLFQHTKKTCHKTVYIYVFWTCVFVTFILLEVTLCPGPGSDWLTLASPSCQALTAQRLGTILLQDFQCQHILYLIWKYFFPLLFIYWVHPPV